MFIVVLLILIGSFNPINDKKQDSLKLKSSIKKELDVVQYDINQFIKEKIEHLNRQSKYNLSKEDGFLDWYFSSETEYEIIKYKTIDIFGSEYNETHYIGENFSKIIFDEEINKILNDIDNYSRLRIEDFYKSTFDKILNHIKFVKAYRKDHTIDNINNIDLVWGKYLIQISLDSYEYLTLFGNNKITFKINGSKVLGIVTKKVLSKLSKRAPYIGTIFIFFSDYIINEGFKAIQIDDTRKDFEKAIDEITKSLEKSIKDEYDTYFLEFRKEVDLELSKL
ncbi:hypothetical protein OZY48_03270 [Aliarcobacter cryaerophilus]|uniref:hypothetical protein n=1 Tax=Aliarcobacter cryaerophilus TaxID=28198 RepID=UPI003BAFC06F